MAYGLDTEMAARIGAVQAMDDRAGDDLWLAAHEHMLQLLGEIGDGEGGVTRDHLCDLLLTVIDQIAVEEAQGGDVAPFAAELSACAARAERRRPGADPSPHPSRAAG